jgi:NAD(P)-dependent dehydrogenase (short-subunit alcohol dehydrogenase family)
MSGTGTSSGKLALVMGASGAIGAALLTELRQSGGFADVLALSRQTQPALHLTDERSVASAAAWVAQRLAQDQLEPKLVIDATGMLHSPTHQPEKSWSQIDPLQMAQAFAVNAIGPALLMKHFLPLLPRQGRSVFATLSAKVGSIGDNRLGGWYSYRASKAALNQLVRTAAIELQRRAPGAICVSLHPGTVDSALSRPFAKTGLQVRSPQEAAQNLLAVIAGLRLADTGQFFSFDGELLPW